LKITPEFLDLCKTAQGGYTFKTIKLLTGRRDAPKGWKKRLIGKMIDDDLVALIRKDIDRRNGRVRDRAERHIENLENIMVKKINKPPRVKKKKVRRERPVKPLIQYSGDVNATAFLQSYEWKKVRMEALIRYGRRCACCGASPESGAVMNVDHIKPRRKYPHLALDLNNLQVLCGDCNFGKGNWNETDWRSDEPWGGVFSQANP